MNSDGWRRRDSLDLDDTVGSSIKRSGSIRSKHLDGTDKATELTVEKASMATTASEEHSCDNIAASGNVDVLNFRAGR